LKHVEVSYKHIIEETVRQVGYLPELQNFSNPGSNSSSTNSINFAHIQRNMPLMYFLVYVNAAYYVRGEQKCI
jgi:hypothetical protein